jgi:hypothetical protein
MLSRAMIDQVLKLKQSGHSIRKSNYSPHLSSAACSEIFSAALFHDLDVVRPKKFLDMRPIQSSLSIDLNR